MKKMICGLVASWILMILLQWSLPINNIKYVDINGTCRYERKTLIEVLQTQKLVYKNFVIWFKGFKIK